jgi:hypothetical protein
MANILYLPKGKCIGVEAVASTSTTAEISLDASKYQPTGRAIADGAWITTDQAITFTVDGSDPNTAGHPAAAGDQIRLADPDQIRGFRAVKVSTNANLVASYFRGGDC